MPATITLDQLIALNDEIAALVRVGVPLEQGLRHLGEDLPGQMGQMARLLAERLERGEALPQLLAQYPESFPPVYRAVVTAGLKTGRLAVALESLAGTARRLAEARRLIAAGLVYPALVCVVAWGLFVLFVLKVAPALTMMFAELWGPGAAFFAALAALGSSVEYWGPVGPVGILLAAGTWAFLSARAVSLQPRFAGLLLGWLPWTRRMLDAFRVATFCEVLSLLMEYCVPLDEGLVLAGESVGDAPLLAAARWMAEALRSGQPLDRAVADERAGLPPVLSWLMSLGSRQGGLVPALRQAAEIYHARAQYHAEMARKFVPVVLTLVIGGGATALYTLLVFGSWSLLLRSLAAF